MLAQRAVRGLRETGYDATFIAVRLPYGVQADETDAQRASTRSAPTVCCASISNRRPTRCSVRYVKAVRMFGEAAREDFLLGNIKARQRMIAQYAVAGANRGLVIGTDHAAEALMGFFTKHGDGAADILPLAGLNKRRVRAACRLSGGSCGARSEDPDCRPRNLGAAQAGRGCLRGDIRADRRFSRGQGHRGARAPAYSRRPIGEAPTSELRRFPRPTRRNRHLVTGLVEWNIPAASGFCGSEVQMAKETKICEWMEDL